MTGLCVKLLAYFGILNVSLKIFGDKAPILQVVDNAVRVDITNALITAVTSILLVVLPLIIKLWFKAKYKVKDED